MTFLLSCISRSKPCQVNEKGEGTLRDAYYSRRMIEFNLGHLSPCVLIRDINLKKKKDLLGLLTLSRLRRITKRC